jgi:hypothetical protein
MSRRLRSPGPVAASLPATTKAGNTWHRFNPTDATIDYGSAASNTLDASRVTVTDDGVQTTMTWKHGVSWTTTKNPQKMAVWWIDTGFTWGQATEVVAHFIMSAVPTDNLKATWGVVIGDGINADDAGWHGAHSCMGGTTDGDPGFSARVNVANVAFVTPGSAFMTSKIFFDIGRQSDSNVHVLTASCWPYDPSGEAFHTTYGNHAAYDSNRVAAPSDKLYIGLCMGTFATTFSSSDDITAVGKLYYSINDSGDQT